MGFSLSGDMSAVNFSSARVGLGEERESGVTCSCSFRTFCREVYHRWLRRAMMNQARLQLTAKDYEQLQNPHVESPRLAICRSAKGHQSKYSTRSPATWLTYRACSPSSGIDLEEFLEEMQAEKALFAQYGVEYTPQPPAPNAPANSADPAEGDGTKPQDNGA
jgi:hypothetical protein